MNGERAYAIHRSSVLLHRHVGHDERYRVLGRRRRSLSEVLLGRHDLILLLWREVEEYLTLLLLIEMQEVRNGLTVREDGRLMGMSLESDGRLSVRRLRERLLHARRQGSLRGRGLTLRGNRSLVLRLLSPQLRLDVRQTASLRLRRLRWRRLSCSTLSEHFCLNLGERLGHWTSRRSGHRRLLRSSSWLGLLRCRSNRSEEVIEVEQRGRWLRRRLVR